MCLPDVVGLTCSLHLGILCDDWGERPVGVVVTILVISSGLTFLLKLSCACVVFHLLL